jgi:hypothetical protein
MLLSAALLANSHSRDAKAVNENPDGSLSLPSTGNSRSSASTTIHLGRGFHSAGSILLVSFLTAAFLFLS